MGSLAQSHKRSLSLALLLIGADTFTHSHTNMLGADGGIVFDFENMSETLVVMASLKHNTESKCAFDIFFWCQQRWVYLVNTSPRHPFLNNKLFLSCMCVYVCISPVSFFSQKLVVFPLFMGRQVAKNETLMSQI